MKQSLGPPPELRRLHYDEPPPPYPGPNSNPAVHVTVSYPLSEEWTPNQNKCRVTRLTIILAIIIPAILITIGIVAYLYKDTISVYFQKTTETTALTTTVLKTTTTMTTERTIPVTQTTTQAQDLFIASLNEQFVVKQLRRHYAQVIDHNEQQFLEDYFKKQLMELRQKPVNEFLADIDNIPLYIQTVKLHALLAPSTYESVKNLINTYQKEIDQNQKEPIGNKTIINGTTAIFTGDVFMMREILEKLPEKIVDLIAVSSQAVIDSNFTGRSLAIISPRWDIVNHVTINLNGTQENLNGGYFLGIGSYNESLLTIWTNGQTLQTTERPWKNNSIPENQNASCLVLEKIVPKANGNIQEMFRIYHDVACKQLSGEPGSAWHLNGGSYAEMIGLTGEVPEEYEYFRACSYNGWKKSDQTFEIITRIHCGRPLMVRENLEKDVYPMHHAIKIFEKFAFENMKKDPEMYNMLQEFEEKPEQFILTPMDDFLKQLPNAINNEGSMLNSLYNKIGTGLSMTLNSTLTNAKTLIELKRLKNKINMSLIQMGTLDDFLENQKHLIQYFEPATHGIMRSMFDDTTISSRRRTIFTQYKPKLEKLLDNTHQKGIVYLLMLIIDTENLRYDYEFQKAAFYRNLTESKYNEKLLSIFLNEKTPNRKTCQLEWDFCKRLLCAEIILDFEHCNQLNLTAEQTVGYWWEYQKLFREIQENEDDLKNTINILKSIKCSNSKLAVILEDLLAEWEEMALLQDLIDYEKDEQLLIGSADWYSKEYEQYFRSAYMDINYTKAYTAYLQWIFPCSSVVKIPQQIDNEKELIQRIEELQNISKTKQLKFDNVKGGVFSNKYGHLGPFYTWRQSEINEELSQVLKGHPITLRARIFNPLTLLVQGLKIHQVGIRFSDINGLQDELVNFDFKMIHSGFSHFYYQNEKFVIKHPSVIIEKSMTFKDNDIKVPSNEQFLWENTNLSPYTTWTVQLEPKNIKANYTKLLEYVNQVDIFLVGKALYTNAST